MRESCGIARHMSALICPGDKYAVIALHTVVPHPREQLSLQVDDRLWATIRFPIPLTEQWEKLLGDVHVTALGRCNLFFLATHPSTQPAIFDAKNQDPSATVDRLYQMLLFTGSIHLFERPGRLTGAHRGDYIDTSQISEISPPCWFDGVAPTSVHWPEINRANTLRKLITEMEQSGAYKRFFRILQIHYHALLSQIPEERLHDFCRCIEGFIFPDTGKTTRQFRSRTTLFVGHEHADYMRRLYEIRSLIEHLQPLTFSDWPPAKEKCQLIIQEGALAAEAISRYCIERLITTRLLWNHFIDDNALASFWALTEAERRVAWGQALSLSTVRQSFDPASVPLV